MDIDKLMAFLILEWVCFCCLPTLLGDLKCGTPSHSSMCQSRYIVTMRTLWGIHVSFQNFIGMILQINILAEFNFDLSVTFVTLQTRSWLLSYKDLLKHYRDVLHINISEGFDVNLSVTFATFKLGHGQLTLLAQ